MIEDTLELLNLIQDLGVADAKCATYPPAKCKFAGNASEQDKALAQSICDEFYVGTIEYTNGILIANAHSSDTHIKFEIWDDENELQFAVTVEATNGIANYTLDAIPGKYKVRAYGTISYVSKVIEVEVE